MKKRNFWYKLDENKNPVPCSVEEAEQLLMSSDRTVKFNNIEGYQISTVFLVLDHNHDMTNDMPILFETMVFKESLDDLYCDRYSTWKKAEEGHQYAVELVKNGCKDHKNPELLDSNNGPNN